MGFCDLGENKAKKNKWLENFSTNSSELSTVLTYRDLCTRAWSL
jgi:hypothetical protein